jgi:type II protein arginine methyltransferase
LDLLEYAFKYNVQIIIKGNSEEYLTKYINYIDDFYNQVPVSRIENELKSFYDCLQRPLQPLMDNLESQTYEVFESDPVKYDLYEQAITKCLKKIGSKEKDTIIMVLGAGRGPLVNCALRSSKITNLPVFIYAIEKNFNAIEMYVKK